MDQDCFHTRSWALLLLPGVPKIDARELTLSGHILTNINLSQRYVRNQIFITCLDCFYNGTVRSRRRNTFRCGAATGGVESTERALSPPELPDGVCDQRTGPRSATAFAGGKVSRTLLPYRPGQPMEISLGVSSSTGDIFVDANPHFHTRLDLSLLLILLRLSQFSGRPHASGDLSYFYTTAK